MPHLLIAGSTGAGKSVCIHALIMSLMYRSTPQEVKILMIDPKRLELPLYNGIPYLFDPNQNPENCRVITDPERSGQGPGRRHQGDGSPLQEVRRRHGARHRPLQ